jgi:phage host-nuclease inhibitor protein Gam
LADQQIILKKRKQIMNIHKLKSSAQAAAVPQSKADAARDIKLLGDKQRELVRMETCINDELAKLTKALAPRIEELRMQITLLQSGVQTWCEAHRLEICGKGKSANLITGEVSWRVRPPSVTLKNVEGVINQLGEQGLTEFVRVKHEVNKDAVLAAPELVKHIRGLTVNTGVEDFVITPVEVDLQMDGARA